MIAQGMEARSAETEGLSPKDDSPTRRDAPPSLPPTGEGLPEEIVKAIEAYGSARYTEGYFADGEDGNLPKATRTTLDATILHHLSAAESERDDWRRRYGLSTDRALSAMSDRDAVEAQLSAALARAERAEKALKAAGQAADAMESVSKRLPAYSSPAELLLLHALKVRAALSSVSEEA